VTTPRVGADRPRRADLGAELREGDRGAAGRPGGGDPDLVDELAVRSGERAADEVLERL
jgi:hypothetical protein